MAHGEEFELPFSVREQEYEAALAVFLVGMVLNLLAVSPRTGDIVAISTDNQLVYACTSDLASPPAGASAGAGAKDAAAFRPLRLEDAAGEAQELPPKERLTHIRCGDGSAAVLTLSLPPLIHLSITC